MQLQIFPDYAQLSRSTADLIRDYIQKKKGALICIASGHTPIGVFQCLVDDVRSGKLNLRECTFISLDEWVGIDPSNPGSCMSMLRKDFFDHLSLTSKQVVFFDVKVKALDQECDRINRLVALRGGLDVMLVGVGINGHIGMNEPGTSFDSYAHVSDLAEETKTTGQKYFAGKTILSKGVTLGLRHLMDARLPIVMANGEKKASIIHRALHEIPTEQIPATIIQKIERGYLMIDRAAATVLAC